MQTTNGINLLSGSVTTSILNTWSNPERVEVNEVGDKTPIWCWDNFA